MKKEVAPAIVRESILLSFRGSEFWGIELDGLGACTDIAAEKLKKDIRYVRRPSTTSLVIIHLTNTDTPVELLSLLAEELRQTEVFIRKTAIVGLSRKAAGTVKKALSGCLFQYSFYSDYEKAKEWVVPN